MSSLSEANPNFIVEILASVLALFSAGRACPNIPQITPEWVKALNITHLSSAGREGCGGDCHDCRGWAG